MLVDFLERLIIGLSPGDARLVRHEDDGHVGIVQLLHLLGKGQCQLETRWTCEVVQRVLSSLKATMASRCHLTKPEVQDMEGVLVTMYLLAMGFFRFPGYVVSSNPPRKYS